MNNWSEDSLRRWKKIWLIFGLGLFILMGCSNMTTRFNAEEREENITIGYAINNLNDTFQTYILEAAKEQAAKDDINLIVQNAQDDLIMQQDIVNSLIQNDVDALIVVPVDTSAMSPITEAAEEAGIPLIYLNRNPFSESEEMPENVFYVGSDERQAGVLQGEYVAEQLNGQGNVSILTLALGLQSTTERTNGVQEAFEAYPDMNVLNAETAKGQRDQAVTIAENWLQAYGNDLNAIIANNDEMAMGAVQALESNGREDVMVMGIDANPDALQAIKHGRMSGTIFQDAKAQGVEAVKAARNAVRGVEQESIVFIDFELVTQENVEEYME